MALKGVQELAAISRRLRVIQWATGAVGTEMVMTILDCRPDLELVGARVYSDSKSGIDVATSGSEPCRRHSNR